jgi:thioredoxin reductase (NADPH)
VLVVDDADSRAARIPRSHNVAGFVDGIAGAELLATMRRQAEAVGVGQRRGRVGRLWREAPGFAADCGGSVEHARVVLLATGASDVAPKMPDVAAALAEGALRYCPVCDGYEVAQAHVGVLCDAAGDLHEAFYLRHFTPRVSVFVTQPDVQPGAEDRVRLAQWKMAFHADPVQTLRLHEGRVVVGHGGRETVCDSLYSALGLRVHSELAAALGAEHDDRGYLATDRHQQTTVPGLYAAGDVAQGLNQISVGIGAAAVAASAMHLALMQMDRARGLP